MQSSLRAGAERNPETASCRLSGLTSTTRTGRAKRYQRGGGLRDVWKTRRISMTPARTRYGTMYRAFRTTSSRVFGTRPGRPSPKVTGSNPVPVTKFRRAWQSPGSFRCAPGRAHLLGGASPWRKRFLMSPVSRRRAAASRGSAGRLSRRRRGPGDPARNSIRAPGVSNSRTRHRPLGRCRGCLGRTASWKRLRSGSFVSRDRFGAGEPRRRGVPDCHSAAVRVSKDA
jgi:hypothetical protein